MRALAAALILVIGAGLGYGWHEVSPRVLGSAPFCGPKYPGMLRAIPEDEYFPPLPTYYIDPDFDESAQGDLQDQSLSNLLSYLGEPSLWRMAQQDQTAIRFAYSRGDGFRLVTTIVFSEFGATINSHAVEIGEDGQFEQIESANYELSQQKVEDVWTLFGWPFQASLDDRIIGTDVMWSQCEDLLVSPDIRLVSDWDTLFIISHGGSEWDLEIVDQGQYFTTGGVGVVWDTWMWDVGSSLTRVSGLPTYASYFDDIIAEVEDDG